MPVVGYCTMGDDSSARKFAEEEDLQHARQLAGPSPKVRVWGGGVGWSGVGKQLAQSIPSLSGFVFFFVFQDGQNLPFAGFKFKLGESGI
jgi:hypothetical protein